MKIEFKDKLVNEEKNFLFIEVGLSPYGSRDVIQADLNNKESYSKYLDREDLDISFLDTSFYIPPSVEESLIENKPYKETMLDLVEFTELAFKASLLKELSYIQYLLTNALELNLNNFRDIIGTYNKTDIEDLEIIYESELNDIGKKLLFEEGMIYRNEFRYLPYFNQYETANLIVESFPELGEYNDEYDIVYYFIRDYGIVNLIDLITIEDFEDYFDLVTCAYSELISRKNIEAVEDNILAKENSWINTHSIYILDE